MAPKLTMQGIKRVKTEKYDTAPHTQLQLQVPMSSLILYETVIRHNVMRTREMAVTSKEGDIYKNHRR